MLILKIVFGIIVTLPILVLAEFLFEKTVDDALVGSTAKKRRVPLFKRILPGSRKKQKEREEQKEAELKMQQEQQEQAYQNSQDVSYDVWNSREWQDTDEWLREEHSTDE